MAISITAMLANTALNPGRDAWWEPSAHDTQVAENKSAQIGVALLLNSQSTFYLTR